jgi:putative DNA primase/helicase
MTETTKHSINGKAVPDAIDWAARGLEATSDVGRARLLHDLILSTGRDVLHSSARGYFMYDAGVWQTDADEDVRAVAQTLGDRLKTAAAEAFTDATAKTDEDAQKAAQAKANRLLGLAREAHNSKRIDSTLRELRALEGVRGADPDGFDNDPDRLAVANGCINLRSGEVHEDNRYDLITQRVNVEYDPAAQCPRWEGFLREVLITDNGTPDEELIAWVRRLIGYGITGHTSEQVFAVFYGVGANGKGVFIETLTDLFGAITKTSPYSAFEQKQGTSIPNDLARLAGARLVFASEGDARTSLSAATVKRLTGEDKITARFLNREFFEFRPRFLLMLASNHKPTVQDSSEGYWRRVKLVPFRRFFEENERDKGLKAALAAEFPGILAWAVRGAVEWREQGLGVPETVRRETNVYRASSDRLSEFVGSCLDVTGEHLDVVKATEVYRAYQSWAEDNAEEHPLRRAALLAALAERRGVRHDVRSKQAILRGVKVLSDAQQRARETAADLAGRAADRGLSAA